MRVYLYSMFSALYSIWMIGCAEPSPKEKSNIDILIQEKIEESSLVDSQNQTKAIDILQSIISNEDFDIASDNLRSLTYHRLGTSYLKINEYNYSRTYLDTAISIRILQTESKSNVELARSYFNRSLAFFRERKFERAIEDVVEANRIIEKYPKEIFDKGKYYAKTGFYFFLIKEYSKAQDYFDLAKPLIKKSSNDEAEYYNDYGNFQEAQGKYELAIKSYDRAVEIYSKLPGGQIRSAAIKFNRFDLLMEIKPYFEANLTYSDFLLTFIDSNRLLKEYKRIGHNNLAWLNYNNNDLSAAEKNYNQALKIAQELSTSSNSVMLGTAYEGLGDVAHSKKQYDKSINLYHTAIKSMSIGFESDNPLDLPNLREHIILNESLLERIIGLKADAIYDKYKSTQNLKDLEATFFTYQQLDQLLVNIRQGYKAAMSRYDLVSRTIPYYEKATQVALELYRRTQQADYLEAAYGFASKNKAVIMLDGLQDEEARFAGIPAAILGKEEVLKKEIYDLEGKIFDKNKNLNTAGMPLEELRKKRFEKTRAYEDLIDQLEKDYPKYYQLKYANTFSIDVNEIRNNLPDKSAVIEYFVGEENIFVFSFSKNNELQCEVLERTKAFSRQCLALRNMTEKDSLIAMAEYSEVAHGLYDMLLQPTLSRLDAEEDISRLIILPDDLLMQVSFESFLTEPLDTSLGLQWTNALPYLLRKYAVSYSYSNQLIFNKSINNRIARAQSNYVGFGLEYDDYTLQAIDYLQNNEEVPNLGRGMGKLKYSDDEVIESAAIMGGKYFVNEKATKSNFMKEAEEASILHVVTHGYVVKENPLNSGLIFTKQNAKDDFILKAGDLYSINLNAEMAVLSACHTGDGKIQRGEGIRSLARAFNFAGCPNVTASLWAAPDYSTKEIMVPFYQSIKNGQPKDISLNNAKLAYIDNCAYDISAMPCNWAHLVSIGDVARLE